MASEKQFEERLAVAEKDAKAARRDAAAALVLAQGADKDVSEFSGRLNAQTKIIQAIRDTQIEHGDRLKNIDVRFADVDVRFTTIDNRLDVVDLRLEAIDTRLDGLGFKISNVRSEVEQGFTEVERRFAKVNEGFTKVNEGFASIHEGMAKQAEGQAQITALLTTLIDRDK